MIDLVSRIPVRSVRKCCNFFVIVIRIVDRQFAWMNLVDRNMDMLVIGIVVHDADTLMFMKSQCFTKPFLYLIQLIIG